MFKEKEKGNLLAKNTPVLDSILVLFKFVPTSLHWGIFFIPDNAIYSMHKFGEKPSNQPYSWPHRVQGGSWSRPSYTENGNHNLTRLIAYADLLFFSSFLFFAKYCTNLLQQLLPILLYLQIDEASDRYAFMAKMLAATWID